MYYFDPIPKNINKDDIIKSFKKDNERINEGYLKYFNRRDLYKLNKFNKNSTENILIIGHGNVIRYYLTKILQLNLNNWRRFRISNCSISKVNLYDNGGVLYFTSHFFSF